MSWLAVLPIGAGLGLIFGLVVWARAAEAGFLARHRLTFRLDFPRDMSAESVVQACVGLSGFLTPKRHRLIGMEAVVFEVAASARGIAHHLHVPSRLVGLVTGQLRSALPSLRLVEVDTPPLNASLVRELRLPRDEVPLRTDFAEAGSAALLASLQPLKDGETIVLQWVMRPGPLRRHLPGEDIQPLLDLVTSGQPARSVQAQAQLRRKIAEPLFLVSGRVGVAAPSPGRRHQLLRRVISALHVFNMPGAYLKVRALPTRWSVRRLINRTVPLLGWPLLVNAAELAGLLAFPTGQVQLPGLRLGGCRQLAPSPLIPTNGCVLARSTYPGLERPLAIAPDDRRRHLWVLGPTGSGKSTLLANLIAHDIAAGAGVVVVDPMGDLVQNCLQRVPRERVRDVVVLDPTDDDYPVGLNVLADARHDTELVTDQVVGIFKNLYAAFWGPRSDDILRAAIATLVRQPEQYTLCEVPRLLTDDVWRRRLVGHLDEPIGLEPFWAWYDGMKAAERTNAIGPVLNKLRALIQRRRIRNIIGQPEGLDLDAALAQRKLVFVSLRKGLLGDETAALLGALFVSRLWQAVQRRAALPPDERHLVTAYLDEFQDYLALPTNVATVLAQARGLGLGLTLAHQHLGQLPSEVRSAVLANARSKVVFQTSAQDAHTLAREFAPHLSAEDLQGLGPYEVVVNVAVAGQVAPPATGVTLALAPPFHGGQVARAWSRQHYGAAAAEVDRALRARHGEAVVSGEIGVSRRQP